MINRAQAETRPSPDENPGNSNGKAVAAPPSLEGLEFGKLELVAEILGGAGRQVIGLLSYVPGLGKLRPNPSGLQDLPERTALKPSRFELKVAELGPIYFDRPTQIDDWYMNVEKFRQWGNGFYLPPHPDSIAPEFLCVTGLGVSAFHLVGTAHYLQKEAGAGVTVMNLPSFDGYVKSQLQYRFDDWVEATRNTALLTTERTGQRPIGVTHSAGAIAAIVAVERHFQETGEKLFDVVLPVGAPLHLTSEAYETALRLEYHRYQKQPDHERYGIVNVEVPTDLETIEFNDVRRFPWMRRILLQSTMDLYQGMLEAKEALTSIAERQKSGVPGGAFSFKDAPFLHFIHGEKDILASYERSRSFVEGLETDGITFTGVPEWGHTPMGKRYQRDFHALMMQIHREIEPIVQNSPSGKAMRQRITGVLAAQIQQRIGELLVEQRLGGLRNTGA